MASIHRLGSDGALLDNINSEDVWKPVYRRVGLSLVLAAGVMAFCMLVPSGSGNLFTARRIELRDTMGKNTLVITDKLDTVDVAVRGFFRSINDTVLKLKGGMENEM